MNYELFEHSEQRFHKDQEKKQVLQIEAIKEFAESNIEMFDERDFEYYEAETGLTLDQLADLAIAAHQAKADRLHRVTVAAWKQKLASPTLKYNPFTGQYMRYYVGSEKWFPAYWFQIRDLLKTQ